MNNKTRKGLIIVTLVVLAFFVSSCDDLFKTYTIRIKNWTSTGMYTIQYKLSSATEWTDAAFVDEDGNTVMKIEYGNADYPDTAYFDIPGTGTYDFRGLSILGNVIVGELTDCVVEYDNMGFDYAYTVGISYTDSNHEFY